MGSIHGTRRWAFEVDTFAVVAAPVARAFKFVFAGFPVRRAAKVGAACVDHEQTIGRAVNPDTEFLLKLGVDAECKFRGISNFENGIRFKQGARQKESKKSKEPCRQKGGDHGPHKAAALAVDLGRGRSSGYAGSSGCFRGSYRWRANILRGIDSGIGRLLGRFRI